MQKKLTIGAFIFLFALSAVAQTAGLTEDQTKSAALEVPKLVDLLELKPGMTVADIAAGFGAWTRRLSAAVGPTGRVYATELGTEQLAALRAAVEREHLTNVTVVEGAVDATNLPPACCDAVLLRDAYHHLTNPEAIDRSIAASLKPGGRLALADFPPRPNSKPPAGVPANRDSHGISPELIQREVGQVLTYVRTVPEWSPESVPANLFLMLFRK